MREPESHWACLAKGSGPQWPEEGSIPDVRAHRPHRRFREELYSDMGRLLWSSCPFLWSYVTMPGLLVLLAICFIHLYKKVPPYYIAWNSSTVRPPPRPPAPTLSPYHPGDHLTNSQPRGRWASTSHAPKGHPYLFLPPRPHLCLQGQEIEQPYLQNTLGWITFLSIIVLLPIPIYPLQHWWYLQDRIVSDPFEKLLSKKTTVVPTKPSDWPKYHLAKPNFLERKSENSLMRSSGPLFREGNENLEKLEEVVGSRPTESYSGFSLPYVSSLPSSVSISLPASPQESTNVKSSRGGRSTGHTCERCDPSKESAPRKSDP